MQALETLFHIGDGMQRFTLPAREMCVVIRRQLLSDALVIVEYPTHLDQPRAIRSNPAHQYVIAVLQQLVFQVAQLGLELQQAVDIKARRGIHDTQGNLLGRARQQPRALIVE